MECLIQFLDDIEDLIFGIALKMERIRSAAMTIAILIASLLLQGASILLALYRPPLAIALAALLCAGLIYWNVTPTRARPLHHA